MYGVTFEIHGYDLSNEFAYWLDGAQVTFLDFALAVEEFGFQYAVVSVNVARNRPINEIGE